MTWGHPSRNFNEGAKAYRDGRIEMTIKFKSNFIEDSLVIVSTDTVFSWEK